jgi:hypothetical protein
MMFKTVAERASFLADLSDEELLKRSVPAEGDDTKTVKYSEPTKLPLSVSKKIQHRKMRSLGMGKHVAGNAHSLANHPRVPGEVTVGEGKTVTQYKAEKRDKKKRKNKLARKSRTRNR